MGKIIKKYCSVILKCFTYVIPFMWFSSRQIHMLSTLKFTISREKKQEYFSIRESKKLAYFKKFPISQCFLVNYADSWLSVVSYFKYKESVSSFFPLFPPVLASSLSLFSPLPSFLFLVLELSIRYYLFDGRLYERIILVSYLQF